MNDLTCKKCRGDVESVECEEILCIDGKIDVSDEFYEVEGSRTEPCNNCNSQGYIYLCNNCGEIPISKVEESPFIDLVVNLDML